jgi:DNA-binding MarR family transcriptional regulator
MSPADEGTPAEPLLGIDRLVHEPARLLLLTNLFVLEAADFLFLMNRTGLSKGNLSSHMSKLERAGYIEVVKEPNRRNPRTLLRLTRPGREAVREYTQRMRGILDELGE